MRHFRVSSINKTRKASKSCIIINSAEAEGQRMRDPFPNSYISHKQIQIQIQIRFAYAITINAKKKTGMYV